MDARFVCNSRCSFAKKIVFYTAIICLGIVLTPQRAPAFISPSSKIPLPEGMMVSMGYREAKGPYLFIQNKAGVAIECDVNEPANWLKILDVMEKGYGTFDERVAISVGALYALAFSNHTSRVDLLDDSVLFPFGYNGMSFPGPEAYIKPGSWRYPLENARKVFLATIHIWEQEGSVLMKWVIQVSPEGVFVVKHRPPLAIGVVPLSPKEKEILLSQRRLSGGG